MEGRALELIELRFRAGPNDEPGNPGSDGFMRLHERFGFAPEEGGCPAVQAD